MVSLMLVNIGRDNDVQDGNVASSQPISIHHWFDPHKHISVKFNLQFTLDLFTKMYFFNLFEVLSEHLRNYWLIIDYRKYCVGFNTYKKVMPQIYQNCQIDIICNYMVIKRV